MILYHSSLPLVWWLSYGLLPSVSWMVASCVDRSSGESKPVPRWKRRHSGAPKCQYPHLNGRSGAPITLFQTTSAYNYYIWLWLHAEPWSRWSIGELTVLHRSPSWCRDCCAFVKNFKLLSILVSIFGPSVLELGYMSQTCNAKILKGTAWNRILQIYVDGIVEDVLDRNGEESSKSCGVAG